ncbi:MAG: glycosyltransferase family 4 protein [Planctomycetes bacterium]|nr:glycosyltransferase family 4 protein [Planctomycetota bacterium]
MRIVLVYQHFMVSGVGSTKPYDLAVHLVRRGHRVTVICGRGYLSQGMDVPRGLVRRLNIDGIDVLCLGVDYRQRMGFARRLAAFLAFTLMAAVAACLIGRYDVMLASSTPLTVGLVGLAASYVRRVPFVFELRDLWPEVPYEAGFIRSRTVFRAATVLEEWIYRRAAAVTAVSDNMRGHLVCRGVPADKLHYVPTGVDIPAFRVRPDRTFLRRHGLAGCLTALYIGSHGRINQLDYLLAAAAHLRDDEGIRIVLIGSGSEKDRLQSEARRAGLMDRVLFLPPVERRAVGGIIRACDVGLMICYPAAGVSYWMPNKFFEYLAAGKPVLANARTEAGLWIERTGCGILTDPDEPRQLADALRRMRDEPKTRRRMGRAALRLARERFDRRELNGRWERILAAAAGLPAAGGESP